MLRERQDFLKNKYITGAANSNGGGGRASGEQPLCGGLEHGTTELKTLLCYKVHRVTLGHSLSLHGVVRIK